jgi:indolepyruvate ferredoxin oxidoreductase
MSDSEALSGIQALARLPILQRMRDSAAGLNTAGFVCGYRGSPLGGLDQALWRSRQLLERHQVRFQPGINEDLAATAIWGTQQLGLDAKARYDGVFALWYGKGPGVDRSMDVLKHANAAGTSRHGGVLVVAGDDHGAKSSTLPHQSEHLFAAAVIPVLNPAAVQEYLDFGLHGWAMSRYSGCWIALKATGDTVESTASVQVDPHRIQVAWPEDFAAPAGGLGIRWPDTPLDQELRLQKFKVYAAMAYARRNHLNHIALDSPHARLGIITTGKSYLDVRQALDELGIDAQLAAQIGLRVYKIGMTWPLDAEGVRRFATGLEEILVVEEKRQFIEYQLKEQLYNWREDVRPRVLGKYAEQGEWEQHLAPWQLPAAGELTPAMIARIIARRVSRYFTSDSIQQRLAFLDAKDAALAQPRIGLARVPHYCSGCPHNSSTMQVPEGSRVLAGIGCHYMALWLAPESTQTFSQMGGEGVAWVGQAPFTDTAHVFANLGDGTYQHSGILAIRQALAAKVSITYKILFNDAVAMTGGQAVEGRLTVAMISRQVAAEGVGKIVVVTDEPARYRRVHDLASGVRVYHRRELQSVQRELRDYRGVSVLIYDQTCAAEKRRRRKRGTYPDPALRAMVNQRVCEGCGDCSSKSNCMSIVPVQTPFGRKRAIDQSSCNKDYSCVDGFCPSFVMIEGGRLRQGSGREPPADALPEPSLPSLQQPYGILVTGVGGTGVVTIGALLAQAAVIEGKGISVLDMAGLAQKGGPVWSHIRIAERQEQLHATRLATGEANALIGCDLIVTVADDSLSKMQRGVTRAVVNNDFAMTSDFVRRFSAQAASGNLEQFPDPQFPRAAMEQQVRDAVGEERAAFLSASSLASSLLGDTITTNLLMLGYAYQQGLLPLAAASLTRAIEMNGVAVKLNKAAFQWGRLAAHDPAALARAALPASAAAPVASAAQLDELLAHRAAQLTAYQDARYARRYSTLLAKVREAEAALDPPAPPGEPLTQAVARNYYQLLAYKDEYEVARLYTDGEFQRQVAQTFEGDYRLSFSFAPPLWARPDAHTGVVRKRRFGPWMLPVLKVLARLKWLRGTRLDPFGYGADRQLERRLLQDYERLVAQLLAQLSGRNHAVAVDIASLPEQIRGYGHVKRRYAEQARARQQRLLERFLDDGGRPADDSAHSGRSVVGVA